MGRDGGLGIGATKSGPQKRARRPREWTQAHADKFVEVLGDSCNVSLAARTIKRSLSNIYMHRARDAAFRQAWDQALVMGYSRLEMMMLERALHGVEKKVTLRNGESRIMREYNDRVALALLKQHRDSVGMIEAQVDEEEYREACERIIDKLGRLREREEGRGGTKSGQVDRLALIALALKVRRGR